VLVLISVGGYSTIGNNCGHPADHLRLVVTGPSNLQAGVAAEYLVSTRRSTAAASRPDRGDAGGPDGKRLKACKEPADEHGRLQIVIRPICVFLRDQAEGVAGIARAEKS